ncbi:MAG: hypothetical protein ACRD26_22655 [Vicinamibacterales bacterium]
MGEQYNELTAILRRVRVRWRTMTALRAWRSAAAVAGLVLLVALVAHWVTAPEGTALVLLWGAAAAVAIGVIGWTVAPLRRLPGDRQVARFVEECCPELEDSLVTAVTEREHRAGASDDLRQQALGRAMLTAVLGDALRRARRLDLDRIVSADALKRAGITAVAATVVLFVLGFLSAGPASRAASVFAVYVFPERLALEVLPGDIKLRAGLPLRVRARMAHAGGAVVPILRFGDGDDWREARMEADPDGGFAFVFDAVEQPFTYSISAATATSRDYRVTVVRPPRVQQIDLHYEYPRTFGLKPRFEEDSGDIYGPVGTRVRIAVHTDKPITAAALTLGDGRRVELRHGGDSASGELVIAEDGSYRVALADADGLSSPGDTEYFIRTLEDRPPDVRIVRPAGDRQVTPIEEVTIEARADDDFGIAAFDLVYSVRGQTEKAMPFRRDGSGMTVNGDRTIYLEDLEVEPGDFVTYYARARDISRGKRATEARSDIFFLEVKPLEEEFVAAQSQAMGGGSGDRSLDDLAEAQKEIIVATWKLDARGRNARGQSQDDIRNVGRAQAELQKRAQTAMGQLNRPPIDPRRRRSPRPAGPRPPAEPSPTDDPMSKAVAAMGKAVVELHGLKTSGALPHEMTALNELLRAQAEVRKRQVQRQQNAMGGGRGSNRQQQDLSSLFDRELARQQSTNYETPNSSETREEQNDRDTSALDRIRELARRQDALNRQQQELARRREQMSEEELRRELEKLTREQSELRRQAEELSRQMQQQGGSPSQQPQQNSRGQQGQQSRNQRGQGGGEQANTETSRSLREVSDEMQSAASDLRRQDPRRASARGSRALDKLRDLEQRMRSSQPDDRRRALGELQLESRQLAEAQRQIANDGERQRASNPQGSPKSAGETGRQGQQRADASRRRAAEQERLADRMRRLEQSVDQLARGTQGARDATDDERKALADAARELDRQKLSERMRSNARAERTDADAAAGESDPRAGAREGQEIARQLERLAERLGAAGGQSAEARRLSEQLARNRELRDRINEIDRQLSEMRRKGDRGREGQDGRPEETQQDGQPQQQDGQPQQQGEQRSASSQGQQGQSGQQGAADGGRGGEAQPAGTEGRPWQDARELVDELRRDEGLGASTPEASRFNPGRSAPGTQAWKQDFATWEELKKQMEVALEKAETSLASQLREQESKDRLNAGATQAVPEQYRRLVDKYYRALAQKKR